MEDVMARKNQAAKRKRKQPIGSPADSAAARTNVLLEDMQRQLRIVAEGNIATRESIERKMDVRFDRVERDISALKFAVRQNSTDLLEVKSKLKKVDERFDKMDERFDKFEGRVDERFAKMDERFDKMDERFDKFEGRVDERFAKMDERFDKMDERFDNFERRVDERFDGVDRKLEAVAGLEDRVTALERKTG
jgi:hypothetical protein